MAYIDLCSAESYGSFNRKLARLTNVTTAVYWAEILAISTKVVKKVTYDQNGYFTLDREYVEKMCAISVEDQLTCDAILERLNILKRNLGDLNSISINVERFTEIILNEDSKKLDIPKDPTKLTKEQKSANKKEVVKLSMRRFISEQDPDLQEKYYSWIDSVYTANRFLTKEKIRLFEEEINKASTNKQDKIAILNIAIETGYDNGEWVVNRYRPTNIPPKRTTEKLPEQKTSTDISSFNFFD